MDKAFIITGTDTGIGKTVISAMLTLGLQGTYWKPIQTGSKEGTDTETVKSITGLSTEHFLSEIYSFLEPCSPHRAAELQNTEINIEKFTLPKFVKHVPLMIEGAGGLMVPLTKKFLQIDLFQKWDLPIVLCSSTRLGTINHTLLSIEAIRQRNLFLKGIIFTGEENQNTIETIIQISKAKFLGFVPILKRINRDSLLKVFSSLKNNF